MARRDAASARDALPAHGSSRPEPSVQRRLASSTHGSVGDVAAWPGETAQQSCAKSASATHTRCSMGPRLLGRPRTAAMGQSFARYGAKPPLPRT